MICSSVFESWHQDPLQQIYNNCTLLSPLLIIHMDSFLQGKDSPIVFKKCQSHLNSCFPVLFVTVVLSWNTFFSLLWLCNFYHLFKDHFNSMYSLNPMVTIKDHTFLRVLVVCAFITHLIIKTSLYSHLIHICQASPSRLQTKTMFDSFWLKSEIL